MSIYEYDEEKHLRMEREDAREEGRKEGKVELLTELVKKKLQKNKSPEKIADELEEDISTIEKIIEECSKSPCIRKKLPMEGSVDNRIGSRNHEPSN